MYCIQKYFLTHIWELSPYMSFLLVTRYNSQKTKCNSHIVTVNYGLIRIVTSYLDIKCTKLQLLIFTPLLVFPKHNCY
jgi:hypothetical protein